MSPTAACAQHVPHTSSSMRQSKRHTTPDATPYLGNHWCGALKHDLLISTFTGQHSVVLDFLGSGVTTRATRRATGTRGCGWSAAPTMATPTATARGRTRVRVSTTAVWQPAHNPPYTPKHHPPPPRPCKHLLGGCSGRHSPSRIGLEAAGWGNSVRRRGARCRSCRCVPIGSSGGFILAGRCGPVGHGRRLCRLVATRTVVILRADTR